MAKTSDLIGHLLDGVLSPGSGSRVDAALGPGGLRAPNSPVHEILNLLGQQSAPSGGLGGIARRFLGNLQQSRTTSAGAGALAGVLLGGNRRAALQGGALGLLGSLALSALAQSGRLQPPSRPEELPPSL
ncbi:MAG: hypothetical protein ACOCYE_14240, partial [Pseudomonadota bacterium]